MPVSGTGFSDLTIDNVSIYPNPTNGFITINSEESSSGFDYNIYDIMGKLIKNSNAEYGEQINISGLDNGDYFIKIINTDGEVVSKKIIKK
jgi:hypothetical protein